MGDRGCPPSEPEFRRIMEATAGADWPQDVRVTLGEKVAEIRKLGEEQGDRGLLQAREATYTLLGGSNPEWVANQEMRHRGSETPCGRKPAWPSRN